MTQSSHTGFIIMLENLLESYYQTRITKFSEFISNIASTLMELLPNNTTPFSSHQAILTFSESSWQIILHTFPEFIPSNSNIFREFLPN